MKSPTISVIMPVFNSEKYISLAIESILNQTFDDFEFLIINDGSTDASMEIAATYSAKDARITIIENSENKGIVYSLNRGLQQAKGKYLARMDADDISLPTRFEKQVAFLDANPKIGVVGTSYQVIDHLGNLLNQYHPPKENVLINWQILFQNPFAHPSVMFRANIGKRLGYNDSCAHCEDYEFWTRFLKEIPGENLEEALLLYRKTPESISGVFHDSQFKGATEVSFQQISSLMGGEFLTYEETETLRQWYQSSSIPLVTSSEFALFDKWVQIFSAFANENSEHPEALSTIQKKFYSVNTFLSTQEQLEQDTLWFSVVICSYNRAKDLPRLLASLEVQTYSPEQFEVIIVDNNSTDETAEIAQSFCAKHTNARYFCETNQGLAYARNRGLDEANGVYVAYVDDDAIVHSKWLETAAEIVSTKGYGALGGPYYPFYEHGKPNWYQDEYGSSSWLPNEACILRDKYLVGGNMFFRKDILLEVGGFPVNYGMRGNSLGYGEETYMQIKMLKEIQGVHIYFTPDLYIKHLVSEKKMAVIWPLKRYFAQGMDSQRHEISKTKKGTIRNSRFRAFLSLGKLSLKLGYDFFIKIHFRNRKIFPYWQHYVYKKGQYYGYNFGKQWAKFLRGDQNSS